MAFLSGYTTRKKITIDKDKIDSNLTDFPVLVKLTSTNFNFSKARSDGFDIRFTASDGTTLLKYERERHDASNQVAEYWVKIPSVLSSADTEFYIYYGNSSASDGANPTNVWDSNFKMVQHMKDYDTSHIKDSTSNANNGTKAAANEPIEADGQIAKAQSFDGSNDYIGGFGNFGKPTTLTISLLFKTTTTNRDMVLFGQADNNPPNIPNAFVPTITVQDDGKIMAEFWTGATGAITTTSAYNDGNWHHVVFKGSDTSQELFVDGVSIGTRSGTINHSWWVYSTIGTGYGSSNRGFSSNAWHYFMGIIDEVRISNVARSAAWIKASYNSGNNSLVSYGGEEAEAVNNSVFFSCNF